jgi:HSP20 family protein
MAERRLRIVGARGPLLEELDELFSEFPRVYPRAFLDAFWGRGEAERELPAIDVCEDDAHYVVSAELPGVRREDVTVELVEGVLTIQGEKRSEREHERERQRSTERFFGAFTRSLALPSDADPERVDATFQDGVLTITIGKRVEQKPRIIDVKAG